LLIAPSMSSPDSNEVSISGALEKAPERASSITNTTTTSRRAARRSSRRGTFCRPRPSRNGRPCKPRPWRHHDHATGPRPTRRPFVATLRDKLWVSLALTIPVVLLSDDVQVWVGYSVPPHAGVEYAAAILGTLVFLYGGLVFIRPTGFERAIPIDPRGSTRRESPRMTARRWPDVRTTKSSSGPGGVSLVVIAPTIRLIVTSDDAPARDSSEPLLGTGTGPLSGPLWILFHASHASLGGTRRTRLRHMRRFTRNPVCGTKSRPHRPDLSSDRASFVGRRASSAPLSPRIAAADQPCGSASSHSSAVSYVRAGRTHIA
jgi:hypothetical protein